MIKKAIIVVAIILLIAVVAVTSFTPRKITVDKEMSGFYFSGISGSSRPISVTLDGYVYDYPFQEDIVNIRFSTPSNNIWTFVQSDEDRNPKQQPNVPYIISTCEFYNIQKNHIDFGVYALNIEDGMLLIKWNSEPYNMIACSVGGMYSTEEILEYFSTFNDFY